MPIEFLSTKLYIPRSVPPSYARPRLYGRLAPTNGNRMVLVSAPPGYGKTTLISSWLAQNKYRACWLSLDESDNDPVRFLQYLTRGLAQIIPAIEIRSPGCSKTTLRRLDESHPQCHCASGWPFCSRSG